MTSQKEQELKIWINYLECESERLLTELSAPMSCPSYEKLRGSLTRSDHFPSLDLTDSLENMA